MIDAETEKLCEEIRETWKCTGIPVDLARIASEEGIELEPGEYGPLFNGRLEYLPDEHLFVLYHPATYSAASHERVRFSIAHELGHYYLPDHRKALMLGSSPECQSEFMSDKATERQADAFAASLLIPRSLIQEHIDRRGMMPLPTIQETARSLQVSLPCAVIRYVQFATEACCVVVSEAGKVKYYVASDEMGVIGFRGLARQSDIPRTSKAWSLLSSGRHHQVEGMKTASAHWYSNRPQTAVLWEDSVSLGYCDQILTILSVEK